MSEPLDFVSKYRPDSLIFLAGAGISMNPPVHLPTAYRFVSDMVRSCNVEPSLADALVESMTSRPVSPRFEVLIDQLRKTRDPSLAVARIFTSDGFNHVHAFLDEMLARGSSVITTNFDNCIENAAESKGPRYERLVFSDTDLKTTEHSGGMLLKIHGSNPLTTAELPHLIITVRTLAQTTGGFRRFPAWRELVHNLLQDKLLIVIGYSGSDDFDLTPLLLESKPSSMLWLSYKLKAESRFVALDSLPARIQAFASLPGARFAQGDLGMFIAALQGLYGLSHGRTKDQSSTYTVERYVSELYPTVEAREELLSILLTHFGQYEVISRRVTSLRSPLLDAQRVQALFAQGKYEAACELFESFTEPLPLGFARSRADFVYSASLYYRGKAMEALQVARVSLEELTSSGEAEDRVQLLNHIGGMHFTKFEDEDAAACYQEVLELHEKTPVSIEAEGTAHWGLGSLALRQSDTTAAAVRYAAALNIYESLGYGIRASWIRHNLGELAIIEKRYSDALEVMKPAEKVFREQQEHSGLLYVVNAQAKARYGLEDWSAAASSIQECLDIISIFPDEPTVPEVVLLTVLASYEKRISLNLETLSRSILPRVLSARQESPAVLLLRDALQQKFSSSAVGAIRTHLLGE